MWWLPETREPMEHVVRPKLPAAVGTRDAASPVPSPPSGALRGQIRRHGKKVRRGPRESPCELVGRGPI